MEVVEAQQKNGPHVTAQRQQNEMCVPAPLTTRNNHNRIMRSKVNLYVVKWS